MGYFANAQYDVKSPIVGVADTSPEGGSEFCLCEGSEATKQTPGRVGFRKVYALTLNRWDISLALNMACGKGAITTGVLFYICSGAGGLSRGNSFDLVLAIRELN